MSIDLKIIQLQLPINHIPTINWSEIISSFLLFFGIIACTLFIYFLIKAFLTYKSQTSPHTLLEVIPLRVTEQSSYSTQQLFNLFHTIASQKSSLEHIFRVSKSFSLEIVSSKTDGIRYVIRVPTSVESMIRNSLISYLPGIKVEKIHEYLPENSQTLSLSILQLSNHFAFPLKNQENLVNTDPIAYLTGNMTKLQPNENMIYQLVISAVNRKMVPEISRVAKLIYLKKDLLLNINKESSILSYLQISIELALKILLFPVGLFVFIASNGKEGPFLPLSQTTQKNKTSNPYQVEMEILIKQKLDQPLFTSSIRVLANTTHLSKSEKRKSGFVSALCSMSNSPHQSFKPILKFNTQLIKNLKYFLFKHRLLCPFNKSILSTSELGDLYHFPFTQTTKTEDIQKQFSKELPAPLSLKKGNKLDVVFAKNTYGGSSTLIGLTEDERRRHMYILGATGTGKSTMLLSMINSDLNNNKGIAVVDPHGDLIDEILQIIPKNRISDVVYFNPDDINYPIGINLLELSKGLSEDDALREKEYIAESIISLFHKIYTEKYSGPRMEYILRNTIYTAFSVPNATLFTIYKLLINTPFRKSVVRNLTDENLLDFWKFEFAKAGDYQKVKMISPITNKIGRFLFSPTSKKILDQERSTIDFEKIMNDKKILLCNLSKGKIGEDNSKVLGVVMMAKLQLAALKRARIPAENRTDFYLYVDEFQNFATPAFAQVLSEARKYRLNAILAHQTTSQLEDSSLVNITLANTGTVICFRTANPEDEKMILPQFRPYIKQGEIASLPSYRFYMRLGALHPEEPFSGITMPVIVPLNADYINNVINSSRLRYARKYKEDTFLKKNTVSKFKNQKQVTIQNKPLILP